MQDRPPLPLSPVFVICACVSVLLHAFNPSSSLVITIPLLPSISTQTTPPRTTMESLVHRLAPPPVYANPDDDDAQGGDAIAWGNLNEFGVVKGMQIPRVPDVRPPSLSLFLTTLLTPLASPSPQHSSPPTQTPCPRTHKRKSSSRTEQRRWRSGSAAGSSFPWIRGRRPGVISRVGR